MTNLINDKKYKALKNIRAELPRLVQLIGMIDNDKLLSWQNTLDAKLIPQMDPDFPLMVTICGAGSSGKSTLFNSIIQKQISSTGGMAGLSRRVLVAINPSHLQNEKFLNNLFAPFGSVPQALTNKKQLLQPGPPLYIADRAVPKDIILLDTPDFDTGSDENYDNRTVTKAVLEASNVLLYIFTNATYNSFANKEFLSKMLRECGYKKCVLVYRCYEAFSQADVLSHTDLLAKQLYDEDFQKYVLGKFRTHDRNEVAAGKEFMVFEDMQGTPTDLNSLLLSLDPRSLHHDDQQSTLNQLINYLDNLMLETQKSEAKLSVYTDACRIIESYAITKVLDKIPAKEFLKILVEEWNTTSPWPIKSMRQIGKVVGFPLKIPGLLFKKIKVTASEKEETANFKKILDINIADAWNELRNKLLTNNIIVEANGVDQDVIKITQAIDFIGETKFSYEYFSGTCNLNVASHLALKDEKTDMRALNLANFEHKCRAFIDSLNLIPTEFHAEIQEIVKKFRSKLNFVKKVRECLFSSLTVMPTVLAVTFVFVTGGVGSGAGLLAHLSGFFGLGDLCAFIAIPVSTGLNELDRNMLEKLMNPILEKWVEHKKLMVKNFLRDTLSGQFFRQSDLNLDAMQQSRDKILKNLEILRREADA